MRILGLRGFIVLCCFSQNKLRAWLFDLILQKKFEVFIMSIILTNMVTMMMEHNNQSESFTNALNIFLLFLNGSQVISLDIKLKLFFSSLYIWVFLKLSLGKRAWVDLSLLLNLFVLPLYHHRYHRHRYHHHRRRHHNRPSFLSFALKFV